jgi:hypothetical protein
VEGSGVVGWWEVGGGVVEVGGESGEVGIAEEWVRVVHRVFCVLAQRRAGLRPQKRFLLVVIRKNELFSGHLENFTVKFAHRHPAQLFQPHNRICMLLPLTFQYIIDLHYNTIIKIIIATPLILIPSHPSPNPPFHILSANFLPHNLMRPALNIAPIPDTILTPLITPSQWVKDLPRPLINGSDFLIP